MNLTVLSDQQKLAKIREATGWKYDPEYEKWFHPTEDCRDNEEMSDCLDSLDVMREAELTLSAAQHHDYFWHLCRLAGNDGNSTVEDNFRAVAFSTARQRADAFLACLPEPPVAATDL